jgi:hypothetical protein
MRVVVARVLVERGLNPIGSEAWGEYEFLGLPSPGDRIAVSHEGEESYLTVLCVHHHPTALGSEGEPAAEVVAKWTGSTPRLR